ncbi:hypothetical protein CB0940_06191 [Cercospora beticola]|uniref:Uncharacterized protein n=1 Tax=Cercospora beticola TaxID=122368 RepID=A0A2G5HZK7_CERBT|nr:hypothetical protein CB0940_06191 [Cercospora beticola]PIA97968.1 hypothetical protein CB0940_06191 [Cercospora beticola]WPA98807.1 hypothetical protein RHO25_003420 [Cercospora beticola]
MPPMAGVEQCIVAIVSAFRGGAELLEATWEQRFGSRRLAETEYELPVREKTLQNALFDAANVCQSKMNERQRQLQKRFAIGDSNAMSELSAIMVHLQVQVINALQTARCSGGDTLDFTSLQSTVMIMRSNTLQSMERLSQRLLSGTASDGIAKQLLQRRQSDPFGSKGSNHSMSSTSMHDPAVERRRRYRASLGPLTAVSRYDSPTTGAAYMQFRAEDRVHLDRLASLWSISSVSSCRSISDSSSSCGSSISSHIGEIEVPETAQATRRIVLAPRVETKADEGAIRKPPPSALPRHDPIPEVLHHPAKKDAVPDSPAPLLEAMDRKDALSTKSRKNKGYQAVSKVLSRVANRYRKLRS